VKNLKKADAEYPFEHGKVNILGFEWSIGTPSHYKYTGVLPNSVSGEEENFSEISPWGQ
jgi:hypothetical protein